MPKLIKNETIVENEWTIIDKEFSAELPKGKNFLPLEYFLENISNNEISKDTGVWLDSDESPEALIPHLDNLEHIAINFPKFADGRGYSYARILRDRLNFKGEIRAIGDVLHDQMFFYKRCGFDAYAVREDKNIEVALQGLKDFSNSYQVSTDQPQPLFRRR